MILQIIAPLLYALMCAAIIAKSNFFRLPGISRHWTIGAFILKLIAGIALWAIYTYYYPDSSESDALRYFQDTMTIRRQWDENREVFWSFMLGRNTNDPAFAELYDKLVGWTSGYRYGLTNDCSTIIRLNVVISFISFGSYHVHAILMSFLAMIGMVALYKAFVSLLPGREAYLFIACFLLPSVVFWSSGLLKEGPLFLALGGLFFSVVKLLYNTRLWSYYAMAASSLIVLMYSKEYVLISLLPALLFLFITKITSGRYLIVKFFVVHLLCFIAAQHAHYFFKGGDFLYVLHKKQIDFYNVARLTDAGSTVEIPPVTGTLSFLKGYPKAFVLTYFRPAPWEAKNWTYLIFAFENLIYVLVLLWTIIRFSKPPKEQLRIWLAVLSFVLVLASILGNCVPILGAMIRYRIAALPFLMVLCIALVKPQHLPFNAFLSKLFSNGLKLENG
jgi:hypothetical protein